MERCWLASRASATVRSASDATNASAIPGSPQRSAIAAATHAPHATFEATFTTASPPTLREAWSSAARLPLVVTRSCAIAKMITTRCTAGARCASVMTAIIAASSAALASTRTATNPPKKSDACSGRTGMTFWMYVSTPSPSAMKKVAEKASAKLNTPNSSGPRWRGR
jgi:hypothetical protein